MSTEKPAEEEVIARLFALLTARMEDGAELAARGQSRSSLNMALQLSSELASVLDDAETVRQAIALIRLQSPPSSELD